ncbi:MAG TPA: MarR family transcriptional regulator [Sphingobium sp.]|nr:MarR family transcriptional regulator [Sphingobium sp.]
MPNSDMDNGGTPASPMRGVFTFRIISLLDLLRRSGTLAHRRTFDLSGIEWRIMSQVGDHAPLSLNELADLLNLDRGQVSRAVKAMKERGLLSSRRRPGGPAIDITLSDEGKALHVRMVALAIERNNFLVGDIPDDELALASDVLDRLKVKAQILLDRERAIGVATCYDEG